MKAFGLLLLVSPVALGAELAGRGTLEAQPQASPQGQWTLNARLQPHSSADLDAAAGRLTLDAHLKPQATAKQLNTFCGTSTDPIFSNGFEGS